MTAEHVNWTAYYFLSNTVRSHIIIRRAINKCVHQDADITRLIIKLYVNFLLL